MSGFLWLAGCGCLPITRPRKRPWKRPARRARRLARCSAQRFVWSLTLAKVFFDPVWYFYIFWFPQYLSSARGFDLARIGLVRAGSRS